MNSRKLIFGRYDVAAFLSFFSYASSSIVIPVVLVILARDLGFSLEEGGLTAGGALHLARTFPMLIAMLLCGFMAGRWGNRRVFGFSVLLMGIGIGMCAVSLSYGILVLALMLAGFGEGVVEGLATPFVQDLHAKEPGRYVNFAHGFWSVGVFVTVLFAGALLSLGISWRIITGAVAVIALIPAALILLKPAHGQRYPDRSEPLCWKTVYSQIIEIVRTPYFWIFFTAMFFAGGGEFCLTFWCASYIQLNFASTAWAGGVGTACFAAGMFTGRTGWGILLRQHRLPALIVWSSVAGGIITFIFPVLTNLILFFVLLYFSGIAAAPLWPSIQTYCVDRMPDCDSTMIYILLSCAGIPGCGFFTFLMGYVGNRLGGLNAAFYLVPVCFIATAILIVLMKQINLPHRSCGNVHGYNL